MLYKEIQLYPAIISNEGHGDCLLQALEVSD